jgi:hypothetical protein
MPEKTSELRGKDSNLDYLIQSLGHRVWNVSHSLSDRVTKPFPHTSIRQIQPVLLRPLANVFAGRRFDFRAEGVVSSRQHVGSPYSR